KTSSTPHQRHERVKLDINQGYHQLKILEVHAASPHFQRIKHYFGPNGSASSFHQQLKYFKKRSGE
ncbi:hypothetical protein NDU88_001791, partial [Pleurodeles waltl]